MPLPASAVRAAMLIVHELATNAAKYGALSTPEGRLILMWYTTSGRACIRWTETGGPPVVKPHRRGFGLELVNVILANIDGAVETSFRPEGVVHEISFALPEAEAPSALVTQPLTAKKVRAA